VRSQQQYGIIVKASNINNITVWQIASAAAWHQYHQGA
jgi:hypothetical protein